MPSASAKHSANEPATTSASTDTNSQAIAPSDVPSTMRAVVAREYGGPEVLQLLDIPAPEVGPGEVLAAPTAASMMAKTMMPNQAWPVLKPARRKAWCRWCWSAASGLRRCFVRRAIK